jgi:hypothetical protein
MKSMNFEKTKDIFAEFALSTDEMMKVRGGDQGQPIVIPTPPPVKI